MRTQQILLEETGAADVVDPLGGSLLRRVADERIEEEARELIARIDEHGRDGRGDRAGFANQLIADSAWEQQLADRDGRAA